MKGSLLWKLILTVVVLGWALASLHPLQDRDFPAFLRENATANVSEFDGLVKEAEELVETKKTRSVLTGLREIGKERRIDLSTYFPHLKMDASLKNVEKRNQLLLGELSRRSKASLQRGLDLQGGVSFTLEIDERAVTVKDDAAAAEAAEHRRQQLTKAIEIIGNRVDSLGVSEPVIRPIGEGRIEVQLAGVNTREDPEVINVLRKPARLDFRLVHPTLRPTGAPGEELPIGYEILNMENEDDQGRIVVVPYFVKRIPEMTGESVENAYVQMDSIGRFQIGLRFTSKGSDQFAKVTEANVNRLLGIVLDGKLYSAPNINEPIRGGQAQISGRFSQREAFELSNVLNNPLDVPLRVAEMNEVGPTLAADAISSSARASLLSAAVIVAFMLTLYTIGGGLSIFALVANIVVLLGVMSSINATLTLPGIAGIVLTMGMSVDSNILIFERIREELRAGKSLKAAVAAGHDRAFSAIFDANVTTMIAAVVMIWLGTGPVKGFGVTLAIGIFTTMFAALVVTKMLVTWVVNAEIAKSIPMPIQLKPTNFDFMKYTKPAVILSVLVIIAGIAAVAIKGKDVYGIDFAGGDEVSLSFEKRIPEADLRTAAERLNIAEFSPSYRTELGGTSEVLKIQTPFGDGARLAEELVRTHPEHGLKVIGETRIGPSVGKEIQINALMAVLVSLVGIMFYVAFRFETGFGVGALLSTIHDVVIVIGMFVLFDRQFSAPMIAALLLIIGYSINDTIVVFDRIREELVLSPAMKLRDVINKSLNITLQRTIVTGITTLTSAILLFVYGSGAIEDLAFTFIVGIIVGTFSSVYIASPIFYWFHKGQRTKLDQAIVEEAPKYDWETGAKDSR